MPMNKVPTLLVGLGGIGCSIADMTSSMLGKAEKEYVGVVGFDTNVEDLKKLSIKSVRTSDERLVKDYIKDHPEYAEWFPVNKFTANRGMLTGAGQIRAISRLAALASIESGRFVPLDEEIKRILKHTGDKDNTAFNVFFVGSITGGTGAGLFLQMPFYIRNLLKKEYAINNIRIRGMFMSADITKNVQPSKINRDAVMVNAYACMKELNAFYLTQSAKDDDNLLKIEFYEKGERQEIKQEMKSRLVQSKLQDGFGLDLFDEGGAEQLEADVEDLASEGANIPYDAFYLIEGTDNAGGIGNASIGTVKEQIAKMIFTLLFTPVKAEDAGILDNTVLQDMEGGGMNRYSSAGMCVLHYPCEQAREYVTLKWVKELVSEEWLLLDKLYEGEKKEAQDRQKSDPSVIIPGIEEAFVRLFEKESSGRQGSKLGALRRHAFIDTGDKVDGEINKAAFILRGIEDEIEDIMNQDEIVMSKKECEVNIKKISDIEVADKEISRVYSELELLQKLVSNVVNKSRYEIANAVFPVSVDSLQMRKDSDICIYKTFSSIHPVAARFLCYSILNTIDVKIMELQGELSGLDLHEYENIDFYGTAEDGIQNAGTAVAMIRNKKIPVIKSGKKPLRTLVSKFQQMASTQVQTIESYGRYTLQLDTYRLLRERFSKLAEYYQQFFTNIADQMNVNTNRIEVLERSFLENPYGELSVYATPESFQAMYQDFKTQAEFELPSDTKTAIFTGIFREVCNVFEDKNKELSELQKQKRDEGIFIRLNDLFTTGVIDTLRTLVYTKGKGIVDMSIKQAIEKELQLKTGLLPGIDMNYEAKRIAYERELVERAMRMAAPMFAVQNEQDITETIYLAISPEAAELSEGKPSKNVTKEHLVPEKCEATDNMPVSILMEPEFSKYEIICFKAKHKYKVENLVKYRADSEYARVYEERINSIGKLPTAEGKDAFKTVVNPHLNRYWHEEGFVPALGEKEREKSKKDLLKAFVYAMGMDTFVRTRFDDDVRDYWYLVAGSQAIKVTCQGNTIGNGYVDLYNSLRFNRKWKRYILSQAKIKMKLVKGYLDADEMMEMILDTEFIEDLIQSKKAASDSVELAADPLTMNFFGSMDDEDGVAEEDDDENILDIFLKMYTKMDNSKWAELFTGLKLTLMEYLAYMFDENTKLVNRAYQAILNRMYAYSEPGKKELERHSYVQNKQPIPEELEFKTAEKKLRAHIAEIIKEKYVG